MRGFCSRGDACSFLHEVRDTEARRLHQIDQSDGENAVEMTTEDDVDVASLVTALAEKACVSVPSHVSFGRRPKSGWARK